MVGLWRYTSTSLRTRMERPWRIVGPRGRYLNGLIWMSRIVRAQSVNATCTCATTAIIISGRWRGRRRWLPVWCAVRSPCARVGGTPSAPQPNCPSVCRAGAWAGTCFAGSAIVVFLAIGRCLSFVWSYRTRTRSGCPTTRLRTILASIKRCWQPGSKTPPSWLRPTGISRRWC
jgi:hypothetical protein